MASLAELLREGRRREVWLKYCGFTELSLKEFMLVQERLLAEQVELFSDCTLCRKIFGGTLPRSIDDFRRHVPLTTYEHYAPYLSERREDVLPLKPSYWVCTSGKLGSYDRKWAPYTAGMVQTHIKNFLASVIFSTCSARGEVGLEENFKFLYAMA
ncbi:MAG: GH3 family domain-containing protein, partial [Moorellales bacterium]